MRTRLLVASLGLLLAAGVVVWFATREAGLRGEIRAEFDRYGCASVDDREWPPKRFYAIPTAFSRRANVRVVIACNYDGPVTYYFRFGNHRLLERALVAAPSMRRQSLCLLDHEAFTGDMFNADTPPDPHGFQRICRHHRGRMVGPPPQ